MRKVVWLFMIKIAALLVFLFLAITSGAQAAPRAVISWFDNSSGEEFFEVQKGPTLSGPWSAFTKTGPNVTSVDDTSVVLGQTVCYKVRAGTSAAVTIFSLAKCATVPNTLVQPTGLTVQIMDP